MLAEKTVCTGCGCCSVVCPDKSIQMKSDREGFRYPEIDREKCSQCHLCENVCPVLHMAPIYTQTRTIAAQNKNEAIRKESSSGGVFTVLAESVLNQGGAVCAARYKCDFSVEHYITMDQNEVAGFRGAKYVQSSAEQCFQEIKNLLQEGRFVLFAGTPCQVAGLKGFLKKEYDNLLLADVICHGVPSALVWQRYLAERMNEDTDGVGIRSINMRSKSTGWSRYKYSVEITYKNGEKYAALQEQDLFMLGFTSNLYLRPSCSHCRFKGIERSSDITLGDYWGIWEQYPEFDDNKGTSLIQLHSSKGDSRWKMISNQFRILEVSNEEAIRNNSSTIKASKQHDKRMEFFAELQLGKTVSELVQRYILDQNNKKMSVGRKLLNKLIHYR